MKVQRLNKNKLIKLNKYGITQFNKDMKNYNTFRISCTAKIYLEINTIENFIDVIGYLLDVREKIFVLGGGSNILVCPYFDGAIIKLAGDLAKIEIIDDIIEMGAGVALSQAWQFAIENELSGLEESIGIPGTIGGATYMNASCYGFEMSRLIKYVSAYNTNTRKITYYPCDKCDFGYRKSIFQSGKLIILRVGMTMKKLDKASLEYKAKDAITRRIKSQPKGCSAGSVFKKIDNLNVSKMLDDMGITGKRVGGAFVSSKHANFILNDGNATNEDVKKLIEEIRLEFKDKYNLLLQTEIEYLE